MSQHQESKFDHQDIEKPIIYQGEILKDGSWKTSPVIELKDFEDYITKVLALKTLKIKPCNHQTKYQK